MLPPGMPAVQMIQHALMSGALVPTLFMADPGQVGALRIDPASSDADYWQRIKDAFYGDLSNDQFETALGHMHPDEPVRVAAVPSPVSQDRFGTVARHYIECFRDRAVPLAGQREMIRLMDEATGTPTTVHQLNASHSPFHSQPEALATLILAAAEG